MGKPSALALLLALGGCHGSLVGGAPVDAARGAPDAPAADTPPAPPPDTPGGPPLLAWVETSAPPAGMTPGGRPGLAVGPCVLALNDGDAAVRVAREITPGALSAWHETTALPSSPTYDTWTASLGDSAFIGALSPGCFSCYHVARIDAATCDVVGGWQRLAAASGTVRAGVWMGGAAVRVGGGSFLYIVGGYYAGTKTDGLWADPATALAGAEWRLIPDIGGPAMSPSVIGVRDRLVLVGGGVDTDPYIGQTTDRVRIASLGGDGAPGALGEGAPLPWSARAPVVAATAGWLYVIGGVAGGGSVHARRAVRAAIGADGSLGAWQEVTTLAGGLPDGYGVGFLPFAQIGATVYAFAGGDTRNGAPPAPKVFAARLE